MDVLYAEWKWYWRKDSEEADGGIYAEPRKGHAYAVCRCPRYLTEEQWREIATQICELHNLHLSQISNQTTVSDNALAAELRE